MLRRLSPFGPAALVWCVWPCAVVPSRLLEVLPLGGCAVRSQVLEPRIALVAICVSVALPGSGMVLCSLEAAQCPSL